MLLQQSSRGTLHAAYINKRQQRAVPRVRCCCALLQPSSTLFILYFASLFSRAHQAEDCPPNYFLCNTGGSGFGDQLEHYVFCLYCAKLLDATVVQVPTSFRGGPSARGHHGMGEYHSAASLLGIDFTFNESYVNRLHLKRVKLTFPQVLTWSQERNVGSRKRSCNMVFESDLNSCPEIEQPYKNTWCDFLPQYDSLRKVIWTLRGGNARRKCLDRGLGFKPSRTVNIVWHIRVGDICLHCDDADYYTSLYARLIRTARASLASHKLVFESQGTVDFLEKHAMFKDATFNTNSTLIDSICRFLTADVLITSGSSLPPFVAAFAPPWSPIVFEERRKEARLQSTMAHHYFNEDEAVRLEDGIPLLSDDELGALLTSVLSKNKSRRFTRRTILRVSKT